MSIWTSIFGKPNPRHVHEWTKWDDHSHITGYGNDDIRGFVQMRQCIECGLKEYSKTDIFNMEKKK